MINPLDAMDTPQGNIQGVNPLDAMDTPQDTAMPQAAPTGMQKFGQAAGSSYLNAMNPMTTINSYLADPLNNTLDALNPGKALADQAIAVFSPQNIKYAQTNPYETAGNVVGNIGAMATQAAILHKVAPLVKAPEAPIENVPIEPTPKANLQSALKNMEPTAQEERPLVEPQGKLEYLDDLPQGLEYIDNQPSKLQDIVPIANNVQQFKTLTDTDTLNNISDIDFSKHFDLQKQWMDTTAQHGNIGTPEGFELDNGNVQESPFNKPVLDFSNTNLPNNEPVLPELKGKLPSLGKTQELEEPTLSLPEQRIENPDWNYERNGTLYKDEASYKKANPQENVLINDTPLDIGNSSEDTRNAYSGDLNGNKLVFSRIADQIRTLLPDDTDRQALTLYRDTKSYQKAGTNGLLEQLLNRPEYSDAANRALQPTKQILQADSLLSKLHDESGATGQKLGFLGDLSDSDDYINRLYQKEPIGTTANIYEKGLSQSTGHAQLRKYNTIVDAIQAGKTPATLDAADLTDVFGQEYSKTLANNKLVSAIKQSGVGIDVEGNRIPQGYTQLGKNNTAVPDSLYNGIKSIVEPNFLNKIEAANKLNKLQGLAKTVQLSASLYHDYTMAMQWAYQNKWNPAATGEYMNALKNVDKITSNNDFGNLESDFVNHTGMTSKLQANIDVLRKISSDNPTLQKFLNTPGIKQAVELNEKHSQFLFDKMQRWMKVTDYGKKVSEWGAKNPDASLQETITAKRSIARQINSAYGGLNWEALGRTPTFLGVARLLTLAPDWTYSNFELGRMATQNSAGGAIARAHIASALIGGAVLTEGLNYLTTGHFTDKNEKGHELEAQLAPGVYTSFLRGGIGDMTKAYSDINDNGLAGAGQFMQGKASPLVHGTMTALTGRNYFGQNISQNGAFGKGTNLNQLQKTGNFIQGVGTAMSPIPIGVQSLSKLQSNTNPFATAAAGIGLAKAGKPSTVNY